MNKSRIKIYINKYFILSCINKPDSFIMFGYYHTHSKSISFKYY